MWKRYLTGRPRTGRPRQRDANRGRLSSEVAPKKILVRLRTIDEAKSVPTVRRRRSTVRWVSLRNLRSTSWNSPHAVPLPGRGSLNQGSTARPYQWNSTRVPRCEEIGTPPIRPPENPPPENNAELNVPMKSCGTDFPRMWTPCGGRGDAARRHGTDNFCR
jgi:hypothetical protein